MNFCYPKSSRLINKKDFDTVFSYKYFKVLRTVSVYFSPSSKLSNRLGISTSAKYFNSVERNKIKRILREFFRLKNFSSKSIDLVFVVRNKHKADWNVFLNEFKTDLNGIKNYINNEKNFT